MSRPLFLLLLAAGCMRPIPRVPANNAHLFAGAEASLEVDAGVTLEREAKVQASAGADVFVELQGAVDGAVADAEAGLAEAEGVLEAGMAATDEALGLLDGALAIDTSGSSADATHEETGVTQEETVVFAEDREGNLVRLSEGEAPERLGEARGVRGVGSARASLGALATETGLEVDGIRTRLADLEPLGETYDEARGATTVRVGANVRVSSHLEMDPSSGGAAPTTGRMVVRVRGDEPATVRARVRVHLVIDRSSSMQRSWGDVLSAARALVDELDPRDEIHVVAYDARAEEVVPVGPVGDGRAVIRALGRISVGGGTNIEAGLGAAYTTARRSPTPLPSRVILLSDGVPNGGAFTASELAPMAARASASGCLTTTIGLGDSFDADVLRAVADAGSGGYHVALEPRALAPALEAELDRARTEAAARVTVRLALGDGVTLAEGETPEALEPEVRGLAAGEERRFVVRVRVRSQVGARVRVRVRVAQGGQARTAEGLVRGRSGVATVRVAADADLAGALDLAAGHLENGRAAQAEAVLVAHADRYASHREDAQLRFRVGSVRRVARAVGALTPRASHPIRRRVALSMGELASRLLR